MKTAPFNTESADALAMLVRTRAESRGRDVSRKRKFLDEQKEGKKKMRHHGKVDIPQEPFIAAPKVDV